MLTEIVVIVILYCVYKYLKELKGCSCVNQTYTSNLKDAEAFLIGFNFLGLLVSILIMSNLLSFLKPYAKYAHYGVVVYFILAMLFNLYVAYNGLGFYKTIKDNCKCADGWEKYYLYFQIFMSILIVFLSAMVSIYGTYAYATGKKISFEYSTYTGEQLEGKKKRKGKK